MAAWRAGSQVGKSPARPTASPVPVQLDSIRFDLARLANRRGQLDQRRPKERRAIRATHIGRPTSGRFGSLEEAREIRWPNSNGIKFRRPAGLHCCCCCCCLARVSPSESGHFEFDCFFANNNQLQLATASQESTLALSAQLAPGLVRARFWPRSVHQRRCRALNSTTACSLGAQRRSAGGRRRAAGGGQERKLANCIQWPIIHTQGARPGPNRPVDQLPMRRFGPRAV